MTVDAVNGCTVRFPSDAGYFSDVNGATTSNNLFGDYTLTQPKGLELGAVSMPLVHIEASGTAAETTTPGQYTFYGRYVGWTAADHREPLPTTFGVRYAPRSDLIVWRDSKVSQQAVSCPAGPGRPSWLPLRHELVALYDLQENVVEIPFSAAPFPVETQRVRVGGSSLPIPATEGWAYLGLNVAVLAAGNNPPEDPKAAQAWVAVIHQGAKAGFMSGHDAMRYGNACQALHDDSPEF